MRYFILLGLFIIAIPAYAAVHGSGTIPYFIDPTYNNISIGPGTLSAATTGNNNTCIGNNTCTGITTGQGNVVLNYGESKLTTGINNVILGQSDVVAGGNTSNAIIIGNAVGNNYDVAIGYNVMANITTGFGQNVAIGSSALYQNTTGFNNSVVGNGVGSQCGTGGVAPCTYDVFMGFNAGSGQFSSTRNVVIGPNVASVKAAIGTNNILIGTDSAIDVTTSAESNAIHIGGSGGDWIKVTGTDVKITQASTMSGTLSLPNTTSATAAQTGTFCYGAAGAVTYDPSLGCLTSTREVKKDIVSFSGGLAEVLKMRPVSFYYKDTKMTPGEQLGVIAEEILPIESRLIGYGSDGKIRGVKYEGGMDAVLISAIQEQQKQIDHIREGRDGYRCYGIFWCKD